MRFYWEVLRSAHAHHALLLGGFAFDHAHHALLLGGFAFDHACLFSFVRKRETACDVLRFYSARVGIALVRSRMSCGYQALWVHFGLVRFFMAIPTEYEETQRRGIRGTESAARRACVFA